MLETIIYPSKRKMSLVALIALCATLFGLFIALWSKSIRIDWTMFTWLVSVIAYSTAAFYGLCFIYAFYCILRIKPIMIINQEGIRGKSLFFGAGLLRWGEIRRINSYNVMGRRLLGILPVQTKTEFRQPTLFNLFLKMNGVRLQAPVNIPEDALEVSIDELLKVIHQYQTCAPRGHA